MSEPRKAIVSYWADALLTGGLSILLCLPYIAFGDGLSWPDNKGAVYL